MKAGVKFLILTTLITLAACSTQEVKQGTATDTGQDISPMVANEAEAMSGQNPPMTVMKDGKKFNLVRTMEGGICKNEFQGAKGVFLLYTDPNDLERIKREKGTEVFSAFETRIQAIAANGLQEAIDKTNLSEDPFALGEDEAQQKLAKQLVHNFRNAAADAIDSFQKETTLPIDITIFPPSLIFYQKGCEVTQDEPKE